MKYLIASDIHGGIEGTKVIIDKFKTLQCDKILLLGDILYHGPRNDLPNDYAPKEVIKLLNSFSPSILAVRGNCDAEVDQMVLNFKIDEEIILNLKRPIYCVHGHHMEREFPKDSIVLHGHTHIITKKILNEITYINVGSTTLPKENTPRCYGVLDTKGIKVFSFMDELILEYLF